MTDHEINCAIQVGDGRLLLRSRKRGTEVLRAGLEKFWCLQRSPPGNSIARHCSKTSPNGPSNTLATGTVGEGSAGLCRTMAGRYV